MRAEEILYNYLEVRRQIDSVAAKVGRDPASIKIVVVTKGHTIETVYQAIDAGIRIFGENYAEEGIAKRNELSSLAGLQWHMIGHVQSRKARMVCQHFDYLHSLDSLKLAGKLEASCMELGSPLPVLLECNVSGESSKFGWPAWREEMWADLIPAIEPILSYRYLRVSGLMTMAPYSLNPEEARAYFHRLVRLNRFLAGRFPNTSWHELSMGMSGDYPVAVEEGATIVRIGTAILGSRPTR